MKMHLRVHFKEPLKMHKNVPKGTHLTLHVDGALWHCIDGALKCAFVSTIEDATESLSESTPKGVLWGLWRCKTRCIWVALEDVCGGTLVRAHECTKRFNRKVNLREHSMLLLRAHLRLPFGEQLKMH